MAEPIYADLHVHTNHSDGTQDIPTVFEAARERGLKVVAIADHDTVNHWDEVRAAAENVGIQTVRAVEMSCYDERVCKKAHIVGLWLNDEAPHVAELCRETLRCRDAFHEKLVAELGEKGYPLSWQSVRDKALFGTVFKMHIFQALMEAYPEDMSMDRYRELFAGKTSKEVDAQMGYIPIAEGIRAIQADGGIAVLAHPCEYDNYDEIDDYVGWGLQGIEVTHPSMREDDYPRTLAFADRHGLLRSGGSDFHDFEMTPYLGSFGLTKAQFRELENRRFGA